MSTEQRALLATVLALVIFVAWGFLFPQQPSEPPQRERLATGPEAPKAPAPRPTAGPAAVSPLKGAAVSSRLPEREVIVDTDLIRAVLTTRGATLKSWELKRYTADDGKPVDLVAQTEGPWAPLLAWSGKLEEAAPIDFEADRGRLDLRSPSERGTVTFRSRAAGPLRLTKRFTFSGDIYKVEMQLVWENEGKKPIGILPEIAWGPGLHGDRRSSRSQLQSPTTLVDGRRVTDDLEKLQAPSTHSGAVSWIALYDQYFAAALLPQGEAVVATVRKDPHGQPLIALAAPAQTLQPRAEAVSRFAVYAGPKVLDRLKAVGPDLDSIVDLGWFDFLARPALELLRFLYRFTGNYGLAIILVTILQKVLFHPLTIKSLRSMQAMQALQPKIAAVQERYKNNPQRKQQEMMELYKKHGVNPMGGCLPMLLQIPIFIALYNALSNSVEMWRARFLWIKDLSQPDALFTIDVWGLKDYPFNLLSILMGVTMFVQQKQAPVAGDPRQAKLMLYLMPTMFTFMFWTFPSGLVLYWLVNNILQIGQQYWLERRGKLSQRGAEKT